MSRSDVVRVVTTTRWDNTPSDTAWTVHHAEVRIGFVRFVTLDGRPRWRSDEGEIGGWQSRIYVAREAALLALLRRAGVVHLPVIEE